MKKMMVKKVALFSVLSLLVSIALPLINQAQAASLTRVALRLDRMSPSTATGGTVCARPTTADTETLVKVTFPGDFTVGSTNTNWTTTTTNLPFGATAWPSIGASASTVSGQDVTWASGELAVGTLYCFNFSGTTTLTTGTAGANKTGVVTTQKAGPTTIDSGAYSTAVVTSGTDQIVITATVPPMFSFVLGGNTDTFTAALSTAVTSTSGKTASVTTNAKNGWTAWVKSTNAALNSASTGATIATAGALGSGPTSLAANFGYVLDVDLTTDSATAGTGAVTIDTEYNGADTNSGGTLSSTFQPIASSTGVTDGDVLTLIERAKVTAIQAAATDYTDTLTVIAAGLY